MNVRIPVSHGHLEGILWEVEDPAAAAVVCHPHPHHGGTMHSHVVFRIADACRKGGVAALRFNFRGVGMSTGSSTASAAEDEDVRAALEFLAARYPGVPLWATGFSFGSVAATRVGAADPRVRALLAVGPPFAAWNLDHLLAVEKPKAFIAGEQDVYAPDLPDWAKRATPPARTWIVPEADHLFTLQRRELEAALEQAVAYLLEARRSSSMEVTEFAP